MSLSLVDDCDGRSGWAQERAARLLNLCFRVSLPLFLPVLFPDVAASLLLTLLM